MNFEDYYKSLSQQSPAGDLKRKILEAFNITDMTFYNRMKANNWSPIERQKIAELTGLTVEELFPETEIAQIAANA